MKATKIGIHSVDINKPSTSDKISFDTTIQTPPRKKIDSVQKMEDNLQAGVCAFYTESSTFSDRAVQCEMNSDSNFQNTGAMNVAPMIQEDIAIESEPNNGNGAIGFVNTDNQIYHLFESTTPDLIVDTTDSDSDIDIVGLRTNAQAQENALVPNHDHTYIDIWGQNNNVEMVTDVNTGKFLLYIFSYCCCLYFIYCVVFKER